MRITVKVNTGHNSKTLRRLLTAKEAAIRLGITPKTLWEWVNRGIIPQVIFPGSKPKYDILDIDRIIEQYKSFSQASKVSIDNIHNPEETNQAL